MSANFYELLKYAATGIASPDMTYYDRMRASTLMGGAVQTFTGIPPLSFKANGKPLISWSMKGNGSQSGTPTPDNPVMPTFCGVRTANILEYYIDAIISASGSVERSSTYKTYFAPVTPGQTYTFGANIEVYGFFDTKPAIGTVAIDGGRHFPGSSGNVAIPDGVTWIGCRVRTGADAMLNLGSTHLPYEPYGWAEKITCAGQTTPVYLGQVSTVRRIKKLVLTGESSVRKNMPSNPNDFLYYISGMQHEKTDCICSHLISTDSFPLAAKGGVYSKYSAEILYINLSRNIMDSQPSGNTVAGFKEYLAAQYAAGTPVTVWYVLAEPTTGIVNEPLAKIGDYCDELHSTDAGVSIPTVKGSNTLTVDTTLQPSEMSITYKG